MVKQLMDPKDLARTKTFIVSRVDLAKLQAAFGVVLDESQHAIGGIELRVNRWMPEYLVGAVDRDGNLVGIIDLRGDRDR